MDWYGVFEQGSGHNQQLDTRNLKPNPTNDA